MRAQLAALQKSLDVAGLAMAVKDALAFKDSQARVASTMAALLQNPLGGAPDTVKALLSQVADGFVAEVDGFLAGSKHFSFTMDDLKSHEVIEWRDALMSGNQATFLLHMPRGARPQASALFALGLPFGFELAFGAGPAGLQVFASRRPRARRAAPRYCDPPTRRRFVPPPLLPPRANAALAVIPLSCAAASAAPLHSRTLPAPPRTRLPSGCSSSARCPLRAPARRRAQPPTIRAAPAERRRAPRHRPGRRGGTGRPDAPGARRCGTRMGGSAPCCRRRRRPFSICRCCAYQAWDPTSCAGG